MTEQPTAWDCLCRLIATRWDPQEVSIPGPVDWPAVLDLALPNDVAPLLRAAVEKSGQALPSEAQQQLDREYFRTAKDHVLRRRALASVIDALAQAGVPCVSMPC